MQNLIEKAKKVRDQYKELHILDGEYTWTAKDFADGLLGDLGDLMKMLQAKANLRPYTKGNLEEDIKHELSDCLWAIIIIADELGIDLESVFNSKIDELSIKVEKMLEKKRK